MVMAMITSKGQTTIPAKIRNFLNIGVGDRLDFVINNRGEVVLHPANVDVSELEGILPKPKKKVSLEAMEKVIRARAVGKKL